MAYFSPAAQRFLGDLAKNNDREWFKANQDRFEQAIREPALRFIEDVGGWFEMEGLPFTATAKKVGGSLSKIHRDVRFSKDKTPYHSHVTIHFGHTGGKQPGVTPALGMRFSATECGIGGGVWGGPTPALNMIRDAIVREPDGWQAVRKGLTIDGESLKRAPKGYDPEHPLIEDIRRKSFLASGAEADLTGDLLGGFQTEARRLFPLIGFLADALDK